MIHQRQKDSNVNVHNNLIDLLIRKNQDNQHSKHH
jgi:hypothetical protein